MKTQFSNFFLLVCLLFNISTSTSQNQQKSLFDYGTVNTNLEDRKVDEPLSPYAMFGDNTATITTQHQKNQDYTLKIPIVEDGVEVGLFEMDMQTGIATMKNNDGDLLANKVLSDEERARFLSIDPMAEKYYSWSPYVYVGNNPIVRTDPTGMDWYTDKNGMMQYDPKINKNSKLQEGQTYIGVTHRVTNSEGTVVENYRKDGSIMYANESSAYTRMVTRTGQTGNETMAVLTNNGMLVLPDYKNDANTVDLSDYGYSTKGGNVVDAMGITHGTLATAHTHPSGNGPSTWTGDHYGDLGFASSATPYKPVYVLQLNGENAVSFIVAAPVVTGKVSDFKYVGYNVTRNYPSANVSNLMNGKFKLIPYTRSNNFKSMFK